MPFQKMYRPAPFYVLNYTHVPNYVHVSNYTLCQTTYVPNYVYVPNYHVPNYVYVDDGGKGQQSLDISPLPLASKKIKRRFGKSAHQFSSRIIIPAFMETKT